MIQVLQALFINQMFAVLRRVGGLAKDIEVVFLPVLRPPPLDRNAMMPMWRYAVVTCLREAYRAGVLDTDLTQQQLAHLLRNQYERWWNMNIKRIRSQKQFLGYAGRYSRRPQIAQHRFRRIDRQKARFLTKDTRIKNNMITEYTISEFLGTLTDDIPDRYRHNIRYYCLLSPRLKGRGHDALFSLLGQERLGKPRRMSWAASMKRSFGVDPLVNSQGQSLRWTGRL